VMVLQHRHVVVDQRQLGAYASPALVDVILINVRGKIKMKR